jgi:hypothetical protein
MNMACSSHLRNSERSGIFNFDRALRPSQEMRSQENLMRSVCVAFALLIVLSPGQVTAVMGGGTMLTDYVMLEFMTHRTDGREILDVAVLLRCINPHCAVDERSPMPQPVMPPEDVGDGSGSTVGAHSFFFALNTRTLWVDGEPTLGIVDKNVILMEETDGPDQALSIVSSLQMDGDLGAEPGPLDPDEDAMPFIAVIALLKDRLMENSTVHEFTAQ